MQSTFYKLLTIPVMSLLLTACGGGGSSHTHTVTAERIADFNGNWQSECRYDSNTDLTYIKTLYVTDTEYSLYTDEFDNDNCFGNSDHTTAIEGFLYYGNDKPYASEFCSNTIEVDFAPAKVFEDGERLSAAEFDDYFDLPDGVSYNLMCTYNDALYTGDLSVDDGRTEDARPLSIDHDKSLIAFD